ncbi:MAG: 16S rRNA (uracil(1498)-N(3))-methyltransferase [Acidobacteria bacterium]|jgi:16S rRNA (uracil1498-N3)-methyltransferase|nr:16S rRNA (uracil(1498)-N(3))-methyltransferase [Acidobacteriota bacterium]
MTRVYMPEITAGATRVEVRGDEAHHLSRVVRARVGEVVGVFDGRGHEWRARIEEVSKQAVMLAIDAEVAPVAEPAVHVTLAIGVLKGDQMDTVVRDATVMGVSALVPLATDHVSVPTRAWRDDAAVMRWQRVAVAAAKQCQRAVVPAVSAVVPFAELWTQPRPDVVLACVEPAASGLLAATPWQTLTRPASVLILVGPEGGWSGAEVVQIGAHDGHAVSLGPRTLRAEAVPAVALTALWTTWGWT